MSGVSIATGVSAADPGLISGDVLFTAGQGRISRQAGAGGLVFDSGNGISMSLGLFTFFPSTAPQAGGSTATSFRISSTSGFGFYWGSGVPTVTAGKGSLYLRTDGSTTNDRMYVNTDGATAWTSVTTAA